jgi:tol-pal system protein YbgF
MNRPPLLPILLAACLALGACSTRNTSSLDARVERQDQQIRQISNQMGQVEQVMPGQAEMMSQIQSLRSEVNMLNSRGSGDLSSLQERITRLENLVRKMASQLAIPTDSLDAPLTQSYSSPAYSAAQPYTPPAPAYTPAQSGGATAYPADPVYPVKVTPDSATNPSTGLSVTPDGDLRSATAPTDNATSVYDGGIKAFDDRNYKEAVVIFKEFTAAYPKHKLAGNAYFWQGESYFQMRDYPRAALAYQEVISKFPGSPKMQSSMLKQGIALFNAEKKAAGKERLQDLVKRYPNSPEATRAKQFLAENK